MAKKRRPKYIVKSKKVEETEKKQKRTIEENFYWVRVITAIVSALLGVLVFGLVGWWMLLYLAGFMLIWPFFQSFVIFRLPYKKGQWDWKKIMKTGVGAYFFIFMLISTVCFTLITYNDYKAPINNPADTHDLLIQGDTMYVADGTNGMLIVNIENYNNRELLGKYQSSEISAQLLEKNGSTIYLIDNNTGLLMLDVSNPSQIEKIGEYDFQDQVNEMALHNSLVFLATKNHGLNIVDTSTPSAPTLLYNYGSNHTINGVDINGTLAYLTDYTQQSVIILNISDVNSIQEISNIPISNDKIYDVKTYQEFLFVSANSSGLNIFNLTNVSAPISVNSYNFTTNGRNLLVNKDILIYNTLDHGIFIINISNPLDLTNKTSINYNSLGEGYNFDIVNDTLYIADGVRGIDRISISSPPESPIPTDLSNGRRTVSFGWNGLYISILVVPLVIIITQKRISRIS